MSLNEAKTRVLHIDPKLRAADWKLSDRTQVRLEVPVDGYDAEPWNGVTYYCFYDASGRRRHPPQHRLAHARGREPGIV
jgi:type I restriction enzyme, R subunit